MVPASWGCCSRLDDMCKPHSISLACRVNALSVNGKFYFSLLRDSSEILVIKRKLCENSQVVTKHQAKWEK